MDWPTCPTTFAPIVGGRFYINISAFRRLADLTPGTSPEDIDRTLFAVGGVKLDPYETPDEDGYAERGERIAATTAEFLADPPVERVAREHEQAQARRRDGRASRAARSSAELLDRITTLMQVTESDFVTLFIGSSVSPVVLGSLQAGLVEVYGELGYDLGRQIVSGLGAGGIESAEAGRALWELAAPRRRCLRGRVRPRAGEVRVPWRERMGDRRAVVGDQARGSAARGRCGAVRSRRAEPRLRPPGRPRALRRRRRSVPIPRPGSVARTLPGLDGHQGTDEGDVCLDDQRTAARCARDRPAVGGRRKRSTPPTRCTCSPWTS